MPDLSITLALLALVALLELSPIVRLPLGLVLAIGMLTSGADLLPTALIGAGGVLLARISMAAAARAGRDHLGASSPMAQARRTLLRDQLAASPTYARITFLMAALPMIPGSFLFPMLGAMRMPLWPAMLGTIVGRVPILAATTWIFATLASIGGGTDQDDAVALGILAVLLLVLRSVQLVDWQHRRETGKWRLVDPDARAAQMTTMFTTMPHHGPHDPRARTRENDDADHAGELEDDSDIIEGELLGEDTDETDSADHSDDSRRS